MIILISFLLTKFVSSWDDNINRVGTCQQNDNPANDDICGNILSSSPYLHCMDFYFGWNNVEIADNVWNFSCIENYFEQYIKINPNISIVMLASTGYTAPLWLYEDPINVPQVWLQPTNNSRHPEGPWPYYLDTNYQTYFMRYTKKMYEWIINSKYYPKNIFLTQAMYGSTGDDTPWHGTPINNSYDISSDEWDQFDYKMTKYIYNLYYNSTPSTSPNLLLLFNIGKEDWLTENCPGSYRKDGQVGHGYQLNNEYNDYLNLGS